MKNILLFTLIIKASTVVAQAQLENKTLYPEIKLKVKGCPKKIVVQNQGNCIIQCQKCYSRISIVDESDKCLFSILYRIDSTIIYTLLTKGDVKVNKNNCYENLVVNFSDSLNTRRMATEVNGEEFPFILIKKGLTNNTSTFTYRIGYLPPSSSPYMDAIIVNDKFNVIGVNYIVPGYEPSNGREYGLLEFRAKNEHLGKSK